VLHPKGKELREIARTIREESALARAKNIPTMLRNARLRLAAKSLVNAMRIRLRRAEQIFQQMKEAAQRSRT
jgi:hypothetical protein